MKPLFAILVIAVGVLTMHAAEESKPNVVILYADDMGYADLGVTGNKLVPTPNIDSLATNGVRFTNSYVTGCVCSPSRAGLLTGRYQQRFGFDANAEGERKSDRAPRALDLQQVTFAQRLKELGYATGIIGKWHLGGRDGYLPTQRGFDEFYGILPHGIGAADGPPPMHRGTKQVETPADHTLAFGAEAREFIERHKSEPFLLYMAFTAVHGPHVAPENYLKKFESIPERRKRPYYAMLSCLDDMIGGILEKLREHQLEENTILFFASDNGGPLNTACNNGEFRGGKWSLWEGGIRSPIFIQWKGHIEGGREIAHPVNQLDWFPTALAAAGIEIQSEWRLDGVSLLPLLQGKSTGAPHDALFWRFGVQYAVRQGDWKLLKPSINEKPKLFNLASDPGEARDLVDQGPERAARLQALWDEWNSQNEPPRWQDERWNGLEEKQGRKRERKAGV